MPALPNVKFGVLVNINQKPVALMADKSALDRMKDQGLDLTLPGPVDLGQIGNDMAKLANIVKDVVPDAPALPGTSDLPTAIQDILKTIETLDVSLDDLWIHIPKPGGNMQDLRYRLRIAAQWATKDQKTLGPLTVKGFALGVESPQDGADASPAKPK